ELIAQGAQAFGVPIDAYYALRDYQPTSQLLSLIEENKIPAVCYCHVGFSGAILYVGSEFKRIGALSGTQAAKILKEGAVPETLPILIQEELTILVDIEASKKVGIELPLEILQIAKEVTAERM
ncbi:MAG: ABC transporter substrate binding protein, partial [Desulfomonilia bacterium]